MSPRAAWRLESLGFAAVYDYVGGKMDWIAAGLPLEGEVATATFIGHRARPDVPTCGLGETVGAVRERVRDTGWHTAVVVNEQRVVLGVLTAESFAAAPHTRAESAMASGPVTFRPNTGLEETCAWLDQNGVDSALVTGPDGTLIGVARRDDLAERQATVTRERRPARRR